MLCIKSVKTMPSMGQHTHTHTQCATTGCENIIFIVIFIIFISSATAVRDDFFSVSCTFSPPVFYLFSYRFAVTQTPGLWETFTQVHRRQLWIFTSFFRGFTFCFSFGYPCLLWQHLLKQRQQFAHYCHCPGWPAKDIFHLWHEFKLLYECKLCSAGGRVETMKIMWILVK